MKMNLDTVYQANKLEDEAKRVLQIDRENMELMKKLNRIYRSQATVDCWNTKKGIVVNNTQGEHKSKNQKIIRENQQLYQRLQDIQNRNNKSRKNNDKNKHRLDKYLKGIKSTKNVPMKCLQMKTNPRCFFDLKAAETDQLLGRIVMKLYADIVPRTCENFLAFCTGRDGLSFKSTPIHRIIEGYLCQGGDVINFNGTGGSSIFGDTFEDENFILKHSEPGLLSMCNSGSNTNNSKFNLTFKKLEILDGKNVVFGRVISGLANLLKVK